MDEREKRAHVLSLWIENVSEAAIAAIMEMTVKEVHDSIYHPSYRFIIYPKQKR